MRAPNIMLSQILGALLFLSTLVCGDDRKERLIINELCKKEHEECDWVFYGVGDITRGRGCHSECATKGGELNEKITVYFCEEGKTTCESYEVYGRGGYADNFKRHVNCVRLCNIVGIAARSSYDKFELCSRNHDSCIDIKKINGSFDVFKGCISECIGWPILENTKEDSALFGSQGGPPFPLTFFSKPGAVDGFGDLKICFKNCISGDGKCDVCNTVYKMYPGKSCQLNGRDCHVTEEHIIIHVDMHSIQF